MSDKNLNAWTNKLLVNTYNDYELFIAEKKILSKLNLKNKEILDVGIGTGRTTNYLIKQSTKYIGIDYSPEMIKSAKKKFPKINLHVEDIRKIKYKNKFDFAFFSYNGIDYLKNKERHHAFLKLHASLKKNGYFLYSFHNYDGYNSKKPLFQNNSRNIFLKIKSFFRYIICTYNYNKLKKEENDFHNYGYFIDGGGYFNLITQYTKIKSEYSFLKKYFIVTFFNINGKKINPKEKQTDWMIYVLCKKR